MAEDKQETVAPEDEKQEAAAVSAEAEKQEAAEVAPEDLGDLAGGSRFPV